MASVSERLTRAQHMRLSRRRSRSTTNAELKREAIEQWESIPFEERPPLFMHFLSGRVSHDDFQMSVYEWDRWKCTERRKEPERNAQQEALRPDHLKRPRVNTPSLPSIRQEVGAQKKAKFGVDEDEWLLTYDGKLSFREQKRRDQVLRERARAEQANATRSGPIVVHDDDDETFTRSREPTQLPTLLSSSPLATQQPHAPSPSPGSEDHAWAETLNMTLSRAGALRFAEQTSKRDSVIIVDLQSDEENDNLAAKGLVRFRRLNEQAPRDSLGYIIPEISLDDIKSYTTQWQIQEIRKHLPFQTIRDCHAALMLKQGDWMAAKDFLIQREIREGRRDALIHVSRQPTIGQDESQVGIRGPLPNSLVNVSENADFEERNENPASSTREEAESRALVMAEARAKTTVGAAPSWQDQQQDLDNALQDKQAKITPECVTQSEVVNKASPPSEDLLYLRDTHVYTPNVDASTRSITTRELSHVSQPQYSASPQILNINPVQSPSTANPSPSKSASTAALNSKPSKPHTSPFPSSTTSLPTATERSTITLPHPASIFLAGRRTLLFEHNAEELAYYELNLDEDEIFDADAFAVQYFYFQDDEEEEEDEDGDEVDEGPPALGGEKGVDVGSVPRFAAGVVETMALAKAQGRVIRGECVEG